MKYLASVTDFFRSPKWVPNLLLGGLCMLIPVVGPMVVAGWHSVAHFARREAVDYDGYPAFNFDKFGKHLEHGVWPFLVHMVASVVLIPVMWVLMVVPIALGMVAIIPMAESGAKEPPVWAMGGLGVLTLAAYVGAFVVFMLLTKPLAIRAVLTQDFAAAFNFKFMKEFTARTWRQQITCGLFTIFASVVLGVIGMLFLCVGIYPAIALVMAMAWHLDRQLYDLYLERGGEPVPVSPKISGLPPPLMMT